MTLVTRDKTVLAVLAFVALFGCLYLARDIYLNKELEKQCVIRCKDQDKDYLFLPGYGGMRSGGTLSRCICLVKSSNGAE